MRILFNIHIGMLTAITTVQFMLDMAVAFLTYLKDTLFE